jgi:hypothetical protein
MKGFLRPLAVVVLIAVAVCPASGAGAPSGFAFLEVPAGARASALGGAYASVGEGVDAAFWNPAGLAAVKGIQVSGAHYEFFQHLRHDQFAAAGSLWGFGVSGSLRALYSEPIESRDDIGNLIGTFGGHDLEFAVGAGHALGSQLRVGGSAQIVRERIADAAATTYAFGAGASWDPAAWPGVRVSLSGHNLGPAAHYHFDGADGADVALPMAAQTGVSYRRAVGATMNVTAALETRLAQGRGGVGMFGVELAHASGAAVRFGLRANDDASSLSMGAGVTRRTLRLDYAFVPYRLDLGDTHRIAFTAQF